MVDVHRQLLGDERSGAGNLALVDMLHHNAAFPHAWGGTKMWLLSAADAGSAKTTLAYGTALNSGYDQNRPQLSDGVCLKCHVAAGGTEGVGITF